MNGRLFDLNCPIQFFFWFEFNSGNYCKFFAFHSRGIKMCVNRSVRCSGQTFKNNCSNYLSNKRKNEIKIFTAGGCVRAPSHIISSAYYSKSFPLAASFQLIFIPIYFVYVFFFLVSCCCVHISFHFYRLSLDGFAFFVPLRFSAAFKQL